MKRVMILAAACALLAPAWSSAGGSAESAVPEAAGEAAPSAAATTGKEGLAAGQYNLDEYLRRTGADITFSDSPYLAGRGLPPVEQRLPANPLVMETWMEHGRYGGTLTWTEYTIDHDTYLRHLNAVKLLEIAPSASNHRYDYLGATIQPSIIETWEQNAAATQFTFRIREGLRWSDGAPVTTADVRYAFDDVYFNEEITPQLPRWANWGGTPVEVEIIDDYSFSLTFAKPYGQAISLALDRNEIRKSIFLDFGRIAQVAPPRGVDFWQPHMDTAYVEYDVDAA